MALTQVQSGMLGDSTQNYGFKNRIINGDMRIDQRNSGASASGNGYTVDRWYSGWYAPNGGSYNAQRVSDAPTGTPFVNSLKFTVTGTPSSNTDQYLQVLQVIEGYNSSDLLWGSASAKPLTASFWVKSSIAGSYSFTAFNNQSPVYCYVTTYTINNANTWEYKTLTIPGATSGTWGNTNGQGIALVFDLGCGTAQETTANTWTGAGNYRRVSGTVRLAGTNGATFQITGVQAEVGTSATQFDIRSYGTEMALCQRYYYKLAPVGSGLELIPGLNPGSTANLAKVPLPVEMRAVPSTAYSSAAWGFVRNTGSFTAYNTTDASMRSGATKNYAYFDAVVASGLTSASIGMTAINDGSWLAFTAEL